MKNPRLLQLCLEPVAICEDALRVCIATVTGDEFFAEDRARALEAAGGMDGLDGRSAMTVNAGVATIPVEGPLARKAAGINSISGLTSYEAIRADLRAALADPAVRSIDFAFDTPGGQISGLFEAADEIAAARSQKPMRALVAQANSAGYVLAAAVGHIQIEQLGQAGSIGVIAGMRKPGADGAETIQFVSSVSPNKNLDPSTDEGRAAVQERVDYAGQRLVEKVAELRGVTPDKVLESFGRGAVFQGQQAVEAGLADQIVPPPTTRKGSKMNPTILGLAADADEAAVSAAASNLVRFRAQVLACARAETAEEALGTLAAAMDSHGRIAEIEQRAAQAETDLHKRDLRAALTAGLDAKPPRVTLGAIRTTVLGLIEAVNAEAGAAVKVALEAAGDSREAILEAVCSVDVGAAALRAVQAFARSSAPAAAAPAEEPARSEEADSASLSELDKTIHAAAEQARGALDRAAK